MLKFPRVRGEIMELMGIVDKPQLLLAGLDFFGDPFTMSAEWTEENEIGRLWKRCIASMTRHGDQFRWKKEAWYEVHLEQDDTAAKGFFEIFVGVEIADVNDVPLDLVVKVLPPATYAVFTLHGQEIVSDWGRQIYHDWLPTSGYLSAGQYGFQLYDERFKGMDRVDESALDVYVPVTLRPVS